MHKVPSVVLAVAGTFLVAPLASAQTAKASPSAAAESKPVEGKATDPKPADSAKPGTEKATPKATDKTPEPAGKTPAESTDAASEAPAEEKAAPGDSQEPANDAAAEPAAETTRLPETATTPAKPSPKTDADSLAAMATTGPRAPAAASALPLGPSRVPGGIFAEDWWTHARPIVEFHGNFRTRGEFFYNFAMGRVEKPSDALWARPSTQRYGVAQGDPIGPQLCNSSETDAKDLKAGTDLRSCDSKIQNGANLRLRVAPEIHISDNIRVMSQIDLFDNLVLGSTPEGYRFAGPGGTEVRSGANELGFYDGTQAAPTAGRNSLLNSIAVKRAWAEYTTPLGELRFGRMPLHWGLGMLYNAGNGHDDDYQTTVDRIQATVGIKPLDLFVTGSWDFANEGLIRYTGVEGTPGYDAGRLDDVSQYTLAIVHRKSAELERMSLARGDVVINAGLHGMYRRQLLDFAGTQPIGTVSGATANDLPNQYARRDAFTITPDLWLQVKYQKFRFELEAAAVLGSIGSLATTKENYQDYNADARPYKIAQYGVVAELEQKLVEDRLKLRFNVGWASGDADSYDPNSISTLLPGAAQTQVNNHVLSMFRFNPAYRPDLILNRNLLQRVQGSYFIKPGLEYDFIRDVDGQRAGGSAQVIWTRASEFVQTPGHDADLGVELNGTLYYQAKDGALNDKPDTMGGFYAALQYAVLFPLAGLSYTSKERADLSENGVKPDISAAQMLRLYLGVTY